MIRRGDLYWADLNPTIGSEQAGMRPVIVVSRDAINQHSPIVVVIPCTTMKPGKKVYPFQTVIPAGEAGLGNDSVALTNQIRAISRERLRQQLGSLTTEILGELERGILIALDLPGQS